jgi:small subunit ribosomal protein S6
MEKNQLARKYELMFIVDARLSDDEKQSNFKDLTDLVTKSGGKIINSRVWLEKHKLSFKINKCAEGTYYLINFEAEGSVINKIKTVLKINERILRCAITHVEKHTAMEPTTVRA